MSSITAADRNRQTDELRNQREDYQNRESEEVKKHKKEMRRQAEKNDQEIAELKKNYETQIQNLRDRSSDQLTEKDQENQAKIDKLRSLYTDSLRKKTDDTDDKRAAERESYKSQIAKTRQINDQQRALLKQNFDDSLSEKDREFSDYAERSRDEMHRAVGENAALYQKKHDAELGAVTKDRDERLSQDERNMKETRSGLENELKDRTTQDRLNFDRNDKNWKSVYDQQQHQMNEMITGRGQELDLARKKMQNHYNSALEKKQNEMDKAQADLKDSVESRIERDVHSAQDENRRIKNSNLVEMMTTKRLRDLERDHVVMDYEDRMSKLEASKEGLIERTKEVNKDRIADAVRKNDEVLAEATHRFKTDQQLSNERHQEDHDRMEVEHKSQMRHVSDRSEQRVNKLMKVTSEAQKMEQRQHNDNLHALKSSYQGELSNQREAQMTQLKDTYLRMDDRLKTTEEKYSKKLEETANGYEDKIAQIQDQHQKELQRQSDSYEQRLSSQKKAANMEAKSQEMKFGVKYDQLQEQHEREIDRLEKRHQEQMASLAQKLNYYRKNT